MNIWSYVKEVCMLNLEIKRCRINLNCYWKLYYPRIKKLGMPKI